MWGWGRSNNKEEETQSTKGGVNGIAASVVGGAAAAVAVGGFSLSSPKSPIPTSTPKKSISFHSNKRGSTGNNKINNASNYGLNKSTNTSNDLSKHRRRSWGGKDRRSTNQIGTKTRKSDSGESLPSLTIMEKNSMHLSETYSGIEVSLSSENKNLTTLNRVTTAPQTSQQQTTNSSAAVPYVTNEKEKSVGGGFFFQQHIMERQKVFRAQFQATINSSLKSQNLHTATFLTPVLPVSPKSIIHEFKAREHRVPLFDFTLQHNTTFDGAMNLLKTYNVKDEGVCVNEEIDHLENEISNLAKDRADIDKHKINDSVYPSPDVRIHDKDSIAITSINQSTSILSNSINDQQSSLISENLMEYDISHKLSKSTNQQQLTNAQINKLQRERGTCVTVSMENAKSLESLISKCGGKPSTLLVSATSSKIKVAPATTTIASLLSNGLTSGYDVEDTATLIRPSNYYDSQNKDSVCESAASSIQQICFMKCDTPKSKQEGSVAPTSFFCSRDVGNAYFYGRLPERMFRRLKSSASSTSTGNLQSGTTGPERNISGTGIINYAGIIGSSMGTNTDTNNHTLRDDVKYLSTGSFGSYYAEFRNGECWWGLTSDDDELEAILNEWDVYKLVFGPYISIAASTSSMQTKSVPKGISHSRPMNTAISKGGLSSVESGQCTHKFTSWIVIGRDGRAAWKNLPTRLHNRLQSRLANETAPVDVALGCNGSYFIRFLDGSTDWQLPSRTAEVCKYIEQDLGSTIVSIALNIESPNDFIIRHV